MIRNGSWGGGVELRKPAYLEAKQIFRSTDHRKKRMTRGKLRDTCENLAMMNSGLSPRIQQAESAPLQIHGALSGSELAEHCSRKSALPSAVDLLRSERPVIMNGGYTSVVTIPKRSRLWNREEALAKNTCWAFALVGKHLLINCFELCH